MAGPRNDPAIGSGPDRFRSGGIDAIGGIRIVIWPPTSQTGTSMTYTLTVTVDRPFADTLSATRECLAGQGFGVLTEIDLQATMKAKLDADIDPQVVLGACRPPLARAALLAEPSVGVLLPCNVVVRYLDDTTTLVEALDPGTMVALTHNEALAPVAREAAARLSTAFAQLDPRPTGP
jgi:uncharacterized protein (DUF302 family)